MGRKLDAVDRSILEMLWDNARSSNRTIAAALDVSEATVRARIKRLRDDNAIRIQAVTNIEALHRPVFAFIWIEADQVHLDGVAAALCACPEIRYVASLMGRADLLAMALVSSGTELSELVGSRIAGIRGVRRAHAQQVLKMVKHDYRLARLVGARAGSVR